MAELRAAGRDPSKTPGALGKLAVTERERATVRATWDAEHGNGAPDVEAFRLEVLPRLQRVSVTAMRKATGLSLTYCVQIKRGQRVPHPCHWQSLAGLAP
jgi:hypothetical protein